jgi:hypothetical protein
MTQYYDNFYQTSPEAAVGLTIIAVVILVLLVFLAASNRGKNKQTSLSNQSRSPSVPSATTVEDEDVIKATGVVKRAAAAMEDGSSTYHLAVKLDRPLSALNGRDMLRFSDNAGFIDLPLVQVGDRVSLEFTIDEDGFVQMSDFTWIPES